MSRHSSLGGIPPELNPGSADGSVEAGGQVGVSRRQNLESVVATTLAIGVEALRHGEVSMAQRLGRRQLLEAHELHRVEVGRSQQRLQAVGGATLLELLAHRI